MIFQAYCMTMSQHEKMQIERLYLHTTSLKNQGVLKYIKFEVAKGTINNA
jgi:hypothetical protein